MRARDRRSQSGQAVVIVVAIIVALTVLGVMVFDAGLAMSDRSNLQAYADSAALAGARSYGPGGSNAHWVAMQYLGSSLNFSVPTGSCSGPGNCSAGTYSVSGYTITLSDTRRYNGIFNYPSVLDVVISHQQPSIFARMLGFSTLTSAASARATIPGPRFNSANYAVAAVNGDALINGGGAAFQTVGGPVYAYGSFGANNGPHSTCVPGVQTNYDGTTCPGSPTNFLMNGGVYKIINAPNIALGSITNTVHTLSGTSDPTGAVAIVVDGSDGGLDISQAVLNGLDDLNVPSYTGTRDPMGTHNFVIWSGSANPYTAGITVGPHAGTDMSGIIYLPRSPYTSDGNSSPSFAGSVMVSSFTVQGGGNGQQVFKWVCGLNAVAGQPYDGGLIR